MQMHPIARPGEANSAALRRMTAEQFLHFGERHVVYMKSGLCDGETLFVLFAADGAPLAAAEDVESALDLAAERGLSFVAVH